MIIPIIIWSGISIAMFGSIFISLITRVLQTQADYVDQPHKQNETALFTMTLLGAGEIIGGQFIGYINDKLSTRKMIIFELLLCLVAYGFLMYVNEANVPAVTYVMAFTWGLQDSGLNCVIRCILSFEFDSKITPYSVFNFLQSLFIFVF